MKLFPVLALLVLFMSLCNMLNRNTSQSNTNSNSGNANSSTTTTTGGGSSSTAMSEDEKHKLFQAAGMTRDQATILEVTRRVGLTNENNMPSDSYQDFVKAHMNWAIKNADFIREVSTPEKAKEYVAKHK